MRGMRTQSILLHSTDDSYIAQVVNDITNGKTNDGNNYRDSGPETVEEVQYPTVEHFGDDGSMTRTPYIM